MLPMVSINQSTDQPMKRSTNEPLAADDNLQTLLWMLLWLSQTLGGEGGARIGNTKTLQTSVCVCVFVCCCVSVCSVCSVCFVCFVCSVCVCLACLCACGFVCLLCGLCAVYLYVFVCVENHGPRPSEAKFTSDLSRKACTAAMLSSQLHHGPSDKLKCSHPT